MVGFYKVNQLVIILLVVLLLSGCAAKERLQWLDNKIGGVFKEFSQEESAKEESEEVSQPKAEELTVDEKEKIDVWLEDNNYNRYGDPIDTMYTGGTPLFSEVTGESIERFSYILGKHPDILKKIKE